MTRRSAAQQAAWRRLPPRYRWLIASEHPDPIEQDENLTRDTMADMEAAYGPREWTAAAARRPAGVRVKTTSMPLTLRPPELLVAA